MITKTMRLYDSPGTVVFGCQ